MAYVKLKIEPIYFCTKTFIYTCKYEEILAKCMENAGPLGSKNNLLINEFIKKYFDDEIASGKQVLRYSKGDNYSIKELAKNDFVLFEYSIDNMCKKESDKKKRDDFLKEKYKLIFEYFDYFKSDFTYSECNKKYLRVVDGIDKLKKIYNANCSNVNKIKKFNKNIRNRIKYWQRIRNDNNEKTNNKLALQLEKIIKEAKSMDSVCDLSDCLANDAKALILVSCDGLLNFSVVSSKKIQSGKQNNNQQNDSCLFKLDIKKNILNYVPLAVKTADNINSYMNKLPKIFSVIDLNSFLNFNGKVIIYKNIFDKKSDNKNNHEPFNSFELCPKFDAKDTQILNLIENYNKQIKVWKCLYLNFYILEAHKKKKLGTTFFNYLSLLVGNHHNYDPYTLFKGRKANIKNFDLINQNTQHLFYEDGQFTYTVINLAEQALNIQTDVNTRMKLIEPASHKFRYYVLWDYEYICQCCSYASLLAYIKILSSEYNRKYGGIRKKNKIISYLFSEIERKYSIIYYGFKNNFDLSKIVFKKLNIDTIVEDLENQNKFSWRETNISNDRFYHWINISFTVASLAVTMFGFGMISKIFIDGYKVNDSTYFNKPPMSIGGLMFDAITTPKFWFVGSIVLINVLLVMLYYWLRTPSTRFKNANLVKLLGIKSVFVKKDKKTLLFKFKRK